MKKTRRNRKPDYRNDESGDLVRELGDALRSRSLPICTDIHPRPALMPITAAHGSSTNVPLTNDVMMNATISESNKKKVETEYSRYYRQRVLTSTLNYI